MILKRDTRETLNTMQTFYCILFMFDTHASHSCLDISNNVRSIICHCLSLNFCCSMMSSNYPPLYVFVSISALRDQSVYLPDTLLSGNWPDISGCGYLQLKKSLQIILVYYIIFKISPQIKAWCIWVDERVFFKSC